MLISKLKHLAMGVTAATMLWSSAQAASTITVGVTPGAANAITDLVSDFQNFFPTSGYNVTVVIDADANLETNIINGGSTGPYDLFLSQSVLLPLDLTFRYPTLVSGSAFPFAKDSLVLYSSSSNPVDISNGLLKYRQLQKFSYADPTTLDPYGVATVQVLARQGIYLLATHGGFAVTSPDSTSSYASVEYLNYAYGFTAKSQICTVFNGVEQYEAGSFHHEYTFGVDYFNPIVLTGIKVARTRTAAQETELTDFVNFLTGVGTTTGTNTLLQHCYKLP